jgi:hypothetical protein
MDGSIRDGEHWRGDKRKEGERDSISLKWLGRKVLQRRNEGKITIMPQLKWFKVRTKLTFYS